MPEWKPYIAPLDTTVSALCLVARAQQLVSNLHGQSAEVVLVVAAAWSSARVYHRIKVAMVCPVCHGAFLRHTHLKIIFVGLLK